MDSQENFHRDVLLQCWYAVENILKERINGIELDGQSLDLAQVVSVSRSVSSFKLGSFANRLE